MASPAAVERRLRSNQAPTCVVSTALYAQRNTAHVLVAAAPRFTGSIAISIFYDTNTVFADSESGDVSLCPNDMQVVFK